MTSEEIYNEVYKDGLNDAWELARKVILSPSEEGMTAEEILECFNVVNELCVLRSPVSVAKEMYDTWKATKEQIQVGDVVVSRTTGNEYIILSELLNNMFGLLDTSNYVPSILIKDILTKTGKHYDLPWLQEEKE